MVFSGLYHRHVHEPGMLNSVPFDQPMLQLHQLVHASLLQFAGIT
jgi:hypothetical protein